MPSQETFPLPAAEYQGWAAAAAWKIELASELGLAEEVALQMAGSVPRRPRPCPMAAVAAWKKEPIVLATALKAEGLARPFPWPVAAPRDLDASDQRTAPEWEGLALLHPWRLQGYCSPGMNRIPCFQSSSHAFVHGWQHSFAQKTKQTDCCSPIPNSQQVV